MNRQALSRGEKILGVASLVVVTVVVGGMAWMQRIEAEPVIHFPPVAAVPSPNGYDAYVAARKSITMWKPAVDKNSDPEVITDPKIQAERYSLARREAWLKANAKGFALFRKALTLPCRHPALRPGSPLVWPSYGSFNELAVFKVAEINTFKLRGDWNGAAQTALDSIQMSFDMQRGGALMAKLTGSSSGAMARTCLEDVPDHLNASEAKAIAIRLEALLARRVPMVDIMEETKWQMLDEFRTYTRSQNWRQLDMSEGFKLKRWIQCRVASKRRIFENIQKRADASISDAKKPYSAPPSDEPKSDSDPFATWYAGFSYGRARFTGAREKTSHELLLLRFALRAYMLDHGAAPAKLKQLVPAYLKAIPNDTFADDAPFHYISSGKTYRLWSVGPDGKDNGGTPVTWRYAATPGVKRRLPPVMPDSLGDWVAGQNK